MPVVRRLLPLLVIGLAAGELYAGNLKIKTLTPTGPGASFNPHADGKVSIQFKENPEPRSRVEVTITGFLPNRTYGVQIDPGITVPQAITTNGWGKGHWISNAVTIDLTQVNPTVRIFRWNGDVSAIGQVSFNELRAIGCASGNCLPTNTIDDASIKAAVLKWNRIAIDASGLDHMQLAETGTASAPGPVLSARAMAIAHIAMADVVAATAADFLTYSQSLAAPTGVAVDAAIAQAAHDTLVALFPAQSAAFGAALAESLDAIADGAAKDAGIAFGAESADLILAERAADGSDLTADYVISDQPGQWRPDPINPTQQPLGEEYFQIKPFVMNSATQFRSPAPPAIDSAEYAIAFDEVKRIGGDGLTTPTERTGDETIAGIYWAYDGTPTLCAPPRLYNQITTTLADQENVSGVAMTRLLALVNVSMADAGIACWESKYYYNYWRPVTGIREADEGTGPTGLGDGNDATVGDPTYIPLCAPASNLTVPNFTPPFPAYPSGHATFGGALFETLRNFLRRDEIEFTFVSDEFNGETLDHEGNVRPLIPRSFTSLSQAEEENGQSRIYLGIHWSFDKTEGITMGNEVANFVREHAFQPLE